ncbi:hypothetical protein B0O99DRAFT_687167 [Bisporella sp. PMI_857]|nr:hypothetical protein B0O99DRAFT_687167 [Bisporella sp. PMI_857]
MARRYLEVNLPMKCGDDFKEAYKWSANEIYNYLAEVVNLPGVDVGIRKLYTNVILWLLNLRQPMDGFPVTLPYLTRYAPPDRVPLELGPVFITWRNSENGTQPILLCELLSALGFVITSTSPISPNTNGLPPNGLNYGLPLMAMYGRWCLTLCTDAGTWNDCPPPTQVAMSYIYREKVLERVILGACRAGKLSRDNKRLVYAFRRDTILKGIWAGSAGTPAPLNNGIDSWMDWGHCAETYPFYLLSTAGDNTRAYVFGKSMRVVPDDQDNGITNDEEYVPGDAQVCVKGPCENCQMVINALGGTLDNYLPDYWGVTGR